MQRPLLPNTNRDSAKKSNTNDEPKKQQPARPDNRGAFPGFVNQFRPDLKQQQQSDPGTMDVEAQPTPRTGGEDPVLENKPAGVTPEKAEPSTVTEAEDVRSKLGSMDRKQLVKVDLGTLQLNIHVYGDPEGIDIEQIARSAYDTYHGDGENPGHIMDLKKKETVDLSIVVSDRLGKTVNKSGHEELRESIQWRAATGPRGRVLKKPGGGVIWRPLVYNEFRGVTGTDSSGKPTEDPVILSRKNPVTLKHEMTHFFNHLDVYGKGTKVTENLKKLGLEYVEGVAMVNEDGAAIDNLQEIAKVFRDGGNGSSRSDVRSERLAFVYRGLLQEAIPSIKNGDGKNAHATGHSILTFLQNHHPDIYISRLYKKVKKMQPNLEKKFLIIPGSSLTK